MAADGDTWQAARDRVNDIAERLHLPPVFWEPPIDYRQSADDDDNNAPTPAEDFPRARYLPGLSFVFSLALHGAVLGYAALYVFGGGPQSGGALVENTATISVELADSNVLEAVRPAQATDAAAASTAMRQGDNGPDAPAPDVHAPAETDAAKTSDAPPQTPDMPQPQQAVMPPAPAEPMQIAGQNVPPVLTVQQPTAEPIPQPGESVAMVTAPAPQQQPTPSAPPTPAPQQQPTPTPPHPAPVEAAPVPAPVSAPRAQRERRTRTAARGTVDAAEAAGSDAQSTSHSGRASASRGQVVAYRDSVQAHLRENKPQGGLGAGTVIIAFVLSPSGGLVSAHIAHSSGRRELDMAALETVHNASPFPEPPAGIGASRLRFRFPFYFR